MAEEEIRINLILTPEISKKLNKCVVKVTNKMGKMPQGLLTAIGRAAIDEWLNVHGDDIDFVTSLQLRK